MKSFRRSKKALSPVVASIILIAVTVAVSIAVAVWMGALSTGFMQTEQVAFGTPTFVITNSTAVPPVAGSVTLNVKNTGTSAVTISEVYINGVAVTTYTPAGSFTIQPNTATLLNITTTIGLGNNYQIKVITAKNSPFMTNAIAS